jgi:hypothetical protein
MEADSRQSDGKLSSVVWRGFVENRKKDTFFRVVILVLLATNLLVWFIPSPFNRSQQSVYVIDAGLPKIATIVDEGTRVDEQVSYFVRQWLKLLFEVRSETYEQQRAGLKTISTGELMKRVLAAESGNSLLKEVIQTELMSLRVIDARIESIDRQGGIIKVAFSDIVQVGLPDGSSERFETSHYAEMVPVSYSLNGLGLIMTNVDNLWRLERKVEE